MAEFLPIATMPRMQDWSEPDFQARVIARITQLGEKETTLLRAVGLTGDEIRKIPKRGRRVDTLLGIAKALRWTVGQALGIQDPTLFLEREREIDPTKLALALSLAEDTVGDNPGGERVRVVADAASLVYSVLSEREANGQPLDDEEARALISSLLRRFFAK